MHREIKIKDWSEFLKIANALDVGKIGIVPYAFRGHSKKEWLLAPTLLRHCDNQNKPIDEVLKIESLALTEFQAQAPLHLEPNILSKTTDTMGWWTLMQHYGAPTRLLDWTKSIFVAAYFAVTEHNEQDGAVWGVNVPSVAVKMQERYGDNSFPNKAKEINEKFCSKEAGQVLHFFERTTRTERMVAQQGVFSVSLNVLSNHGKIFDDIFEPDSSTVQYTKLIIPAELKNQFAKSLRSMNLTASSLFPGLDGLGKSIREFINFA